MSRELREDAQEVIEQQGWDDDSVLLHLSRFINENGLANGLAAYLKEKAGDENGEPVKVDPDVICSVCGSDDVSYAVWYHTKSKMVGDGFGTWNWGDNSYCNNCNENHDLLVKEVDGDRFTKTWEKFKGTSS